MDRNKLIKTIALLFFMLFIMDFIADKFYWYYSIWYFDMIMHALGGIAVGLAYIYVFPPKDNSVKSFLKILLFVLIIGLAWEVFEIIFHDIIARDLFNPIDTISDIFFDLGGGVMAIIYYLKRIMLASVNEL